MQYIHIRHWEKTQHYKFRNPPWIRLYVEILDKYDENGRIKKFRKMTDSAKLTFLMLLCLGSRFKNNIPYENNKNLKELLGVKSLNLSNLIDAEYIWIDDKYASMDASMDASKTSTKMLDTEYRVQSTDLREQILPIQEER